MKKLRHPNIVRLFEVVDDEHHDKIRCKKQRTLSAGHSARFGKFEPLAYLGCWLLGAEAVGSRSEHRDFVPDVEDIEEFMKLQGWM